MKKHLLLLFFFLQYNSISAQFLNDNESKQLVINGLDKLYNYELKEADAYFQKVKSKYPNHPITPLITASQLQWQYLPIEKNPKALLLYLNTLEKCRELAEKLYQDDIRKAEANFFLLAAHGSIALMHNYTKDYLKAGNEARKAYGYVKDGMKMLDKNPEFYYTSGLYNYYIVQYPETHPIVKPVMLFFDDGNKKLGLQQLEIASQKSIFSRIEAMYYLAGIYLKYESNPQKSLQYTKTLKENYPNNSLYLMRHTEGLVLTAKYDEALPQIAILKKNKNSLYQIAVNVFEGIIAEKFKKNDALATEYYNNALKFQSSDYADDYYAMAYTGLARISNRAGNKKRAKILYDKCLDIAEYNSTIKEAKAYK